jgi:hypothetical protein
MKRGRDDVFEWRLVFHQTNSFRTLIDIVSNVINRVNIKVCNDDDFKGISVESVDPKRVCLVAAKLACEVNVGDEFDNDQDTMFCVDTTTLSTCLRAVSQNYSINITKYNGSEEVVMKSFELIQNSFCSIFKLPTLAHDYEKVVLSEIDHDYIVDFDMSTLRTIVKNCIALKGENVSLCVEKPKSDDSLTLKKTILTVASEGNAEQAHVFRSVTEHEMTNPGKATVIKANESTEIQGDFEDMVEWYNETFSAMYLNLFMKNMEKNSLCMRLSPNMPLVINYPLDTDKSNICFVLASKTKDN